MGRLLLICFLILSGQLAASAQTYRIQVDGFVMPSLNMPVRIFAEKADGDEFERLPVRQYKLESPSARPLGADRRSYEFLLDPKAVYLENGNVTFHLSTEGKSIPLTLKIPVLESIRFNLYTDSIKPILNYYLNVEGIFSNGRVFPLDTSLLAVVSDKGSMNGMEWVLPENHDFEKVTFTATAKYNPELTQTMTLYLKKFVDPRDDPGYKDKTEEEILRDIRRR